MLNYYLKTAFRNLFKNKTYSFINIGGLAIGMACTIMIMLWINYEFSFDGFHENKNQIFWAVRSYDSPDGKKEYSPVTVLPLAKALTTEYPEITKAARFNDAFGEFPLRFTKCFMLTAHLPIRIFLKYSHSRFCMEQNLPRCRIPIRWY